MPSRLLLSLAGAGLIAVSASAEPSPDPTNAQAPTAPLDYRSSFEGYQRFEAQKPISWRRSNREVGAPRGRDVETAPAAPAPPAGGHKH